MLNNWAGNLYFSAGNLNPRAELLNIWAEYLSLSAGNLNNWTEMLNNWARNLNSETGLLNSGEGNLCFSAPNLNNSVEKYNPSQGMLVFMFVCYLLLYHQHINGKLVGKNTVDDSKSGPWSDEVSARVNWLNNFRNIEYRTRNNDLRSQHTSSF